MKDIIKISINNWFADIHYPNTPFFRSMMDDCSMFEFTDEYCKENKICAYEGPIDMSQNIVMVVPKEWVEKNCPELLTNDKYKKFVYDNDDDTDRFGWPFPEYEEDNYGIRYYDEDESYIDDDDETNC